MPFHNTLYISNHREEVLEKLFGAPKINDLGAYPLDFGGYEEGLSEDGVGDLVEEAEEEEDGDFSGEEALEGVGEGDLLVANTPTTAMKTSATITRSSVLKKLRQYGISGVLSYGLLNTVYYKVGDEGENHHKVDDHQGKEKSAGGFFSILRRGSH
ncbi:hypothetical protein J1N35_006868 [Gossypium stocksii]|uniref:Uncharacterized protein n=1 Tax=Gossypium stocksii TaxID=47602 RepID=A0A9D4AF13_9ROSI|nr:hypothetical protein J1N35_006868 [Gossypium stocksii]